MLTDQHECPQIAFVCIDASSTFSWERSDWDPKFKKKFSSVTFYILNSEPVLEVLLFPLEHLALRRKVVHISSSQQPGTLVPTGLSRCHVAPQSP